MFYPEISQNFSSLDVCPFSSKVAQLEVKQMENDFSNCIIQPRVIERQAKNFDCC